MDSDAHIPLIKFNYNEFKKLHLVHPEQNQNGRQPLKMVLAKHLLQTLL